MNKKATSGTILIVLLLSMLTLAIDFQLAKAEPTTITVPDDYSTIQEAINAASPGDAVYVRSGTYYEHVVLNKTVLLVGENRMTTIIDGDFTGTATRITANNVEIAGFTIRNTWSRGIWSRGSNTLIQNNTLTNCGAYGIFIDGVCNTITYNNISGCYAGILLFGDEANDCRIEKNIISNCVQGVRNFAERVILSENIFTNNKYGIHFGSGSSDCSLNNNTLVNNNVGLSLGASRWNTLIGNNFTANIRHFEFRIGISHEYYDHNIDSSNLVNGKKFYYLRNQHDIIIDQSSFPDIGYLAVVHTRPPWTSLNVTIRNVTLANMDQGVLFVYVRGSKIENCNIINNLCGLRLIMSSGNIYCHNNFINNREQVWNSAHYYQNTWDDGYPSGGNYWSDQYHGDCADHYSGLSQDVPGSDGIVDTPYSIDENNQDNYPLMNPWSPVPPVEDTEAYVEYVNETIQDLPDGIFNRTAEDVPDVKNDLSDLFVDALENVNEGNYTRAIEKLNRVKEKIYEEIVESTERQEIISMIDKLIAYLEKRDES